MSRNHMKRVRVAADRWNFETSDGAFITPLGGNILNDQHPGQGTLFDNFDQADCDRRFGIMAELGLNVEHQALALTRALSACRVVPRGRDRLSQPEDARLPPVQLRHLSWPDGLRRGHRHHAVEPCHSKCPGSLTIRENYETSPHCPRLLES
jgi:hypothetical protein